MNVNSMLPRLKITSIQRTGKPYKLDPIPAELTYTIDGMEYSLKVSRIKTGNLERDFFICQSCGRACTTLYFKDSPQCSKCAKPQKVKPSLESLYRELSEAIAHNRKLEKIGYKKGNKKIKALAAQIVRLEADLAKKL